MEHKSHFANIPPLFPYSPSFFPLPAPFHKKSGRGQRPPSYEYARVINNPKFYLKCLLLVVCSVVEDEGEEPEEEDGQAARVGHLGVGAADRVTMYVCIFISLH